MNSIWSHANPQLRDLAVYEPGKPIEETARELGVDPRDIIKLASNENPLGPSERAIAAVRQAITGAQLYPDGGAFYLREALAARFGLRRDNIILGTGSNEVIEFLGHAFLRPGDDIVTSQYAFIVYKLIATLVRRPHHRDAKPGLSIPSRCSARRGHAENTPHLHCQPK